MVEFVGIVVYLIAVLAFFDGIYHRQREKFDIDAQGSWAKDIFPQTGLGTWGAPMVRTSLFLTALSGIRQMYRLGRDSAPIDGAVIEIFLTTLFWSMPAVAYFLGRFVSFSFTLILSLYWKRTGAWYGL